MTNVATSISGPTASGTAAPKGLLERAIGVIVSPRETYADVAARPRVLGALLLVLLIAIGAQTALLLTEVGKDALFDQQIRSIESFGMQINDQMYDSMERSLQWAPYFGAAGTLIAFPIVFLVVSGIILGVFNAVMDGEATFKQVYAIVVHSGFLIALQQLFVNPLNYARESMSSPSNLAVFFPFLDETSFPAMLLGGLDLFFVWLIVNLAIGIAVLYKKRTSPIAMTMMGIYVSLVFVFAGVRSALSGA